MKATILFRIAGILLIVAAAGHTYGLVRFWLIARAMNPAPFPQGHGLSYTTVVLALWVFCSLCILFGAYLAWHLGTLAKTTPHAIGALGWMLFAYQLLGIYVSFNALSGLVRILTLVLAICVGWAAWLSTGARLGSAKAN